MTLTTTTKEQQQNQEQSQSHPRPCVLAEQIAIAPTLPINVGAMLSSRALQDIVAETLPDE